MAIREEENIIIYHNTRCSKSRDACSILEKKKVKAEVVEYLKTPPTMAQLKNILKMLGINAEALVRKKEPLFQEKYKGKKFSEEGWIKLMVKHPILIERPIVVKGKKAIIARPPEKLLEFI